MKKNTSVVLLTGVSSGIGRALAKKLVERGYIVWGVARRLHLLRSLHSELGDNSNFFYTPVDLSLLDSWQKLVSEMERKKIIPTIVIFNAAISEQDLLHTVNAKITKRIFSINFFSIIEGIEVLLKFVKSKTQFIAISSLSALKGSGIEGIGYPASKAALSIAFESLHRRLGKKYYFKTIYFGPVATGMGPFKKYPFVLGEKDAVEAIIKAINSKMVIFYHPSFVIFAFRLLRLLPARTYFWLLAIIESLHLKFSKRRKLVNLPSG